MKNSDNIVITSWLTSKKDPQRLFYQPTSFESIREWYNSIIKLNLNGIIFHDSFSNEFIKKYSNKNIKFIKDRGFAEQSLCAADYRWKMYFDFLLKEKFENIFMTDCNDVVIKQNPFVSKFYQSNTESLFIGVESFPRLNKENPWMINICNYAYRNNNQGFPFFHKPTLNCGIVGGTRNIVLKLLKGMFNEINNSKPLEKECMELGIPFTVDMAALNFCAYSTFNSSQILTDEPIHSIYKKYQTNRNDIWFIHK